MIAATLNYTVDTGIKPVTETFGPNNIRSRNTATHDPRNVAIHDGRPQAAKFTLDENGFAFIEHRTRMRDFFDPQELKAVYYPEVEALVRRVAGAARVVVFDHTLRSGDDVEREARLVRQPVLSVHNDYTERSTPQRVRDATCSPRKRNACSRAALRSSRSGARSTSRSARIRSRSRMRRAWRARI
jgi:hypothetical protein